MAALHGVLIWGRGSTLASRRVKPATFWALLWGIVARVCPVAARSLLRPPALYKTHSKGHCL